MMWNDLVYGGGNLVFLLATAALLVKNNRNRGREQNTAVSFIFAATLGVMGYTLATMGMMFGACMTIWNGILWFGIAMTKYRMVV